MTLPVNYYVYGIVKDSNDSPVNGATVRAITSSGYLSDTTDANGKYSCPTQAPSVSSDTDYYFRAYDDEQKPSI